LSADQTTASVSLSFTGLSSNETSAGIHRADAPGISGPLLFPLPVSSSGTLVGFQIHLTSGQLASLKAGLLYVNVSNTSFPNGEIRASLEFNPADDPGLFVGQSYHDFLSRQADSDGQAYWTDRITSCGSDLMCINERRVEVSNAFYFEQEYQQTGAYVFRLYRAAYGNSQPFPNPDTANLAEGKKLPGYEVFVPDRARVVGGTNVAQSQLALANVFVKRPEFLASYPNALDGPSFISAVLDTIQNGSGADLGSQASALLTLFNAGGRAAVLYRLADDSLATNPINNRAFIDAEYNRAFVFTQYSGYLRRNADMAGFLFWLGKVNAGPLRNGNTQHAMVCSFITATEYQQRFSSAVTHSNADCPQ
jgi:hypothetical protein